MSDQVKFMNAYIDVTSASLHEYLNQILQYKTQIKVSAETTAALQSEIENLKKELENSKSEGADKDVALQKLNELENTNRSLQNKAGHLDTALNQINEMKSIISSKDNELNGIKAELESHKTTISHKDNELNVVRTEFTNQISDLQKTLSLKEDIITSLERELSEFQSSKKVINKKKTTQNSSDVLFNIDKSGLVKTDDF